MTKLYDMAIIGGGLAGCSTALHASLQGASVILVEQSRCGAQASGVNYGGVRQQGRHPAEMALARRSRAIWGNLPNLIGTDCDFAATGHLKLARNDADLADLSAHRLLLGDHGIRADLLDATDLKRRFPYLAKHYVGGSFCPEDGQANPRLVAPAFARAARLMGANILENCRVISAETGTGGFFLRLDAEPTQIRARRLVNTAGAWGAAVAAQFGDHVEEAVMARTCVSPSRSRP